MIQEGLKTLDELLPALDRARERREPGHAASLHALETIRNAVVTTRAYVADEMLRLDGSRDSARFSAVVRLWRQATAEVVALDLAGPEKALLKGEGWQKPDRWRKLEKKGGWELMQELLAHCEWILSSLPAAARR